MADHLIRAVSQDGSLRAVVAETSGLVREICRKQQTDLTASVALGRLLSGGALLSCLLKGNQRLALVIEGNGPLRRLSVEADASGHIRGKVSHPVAGLPPREGRFDVAGAVGRAGFLKVWKDLGLKEPYQSLVQLQTSEIAEDLAWYLTTSEQVPSSVGLGVELDQAGEIAAAGGFLVQSLPPEQPQQLEKVIETVRQLPPVTSLLRQGLTPREILQRLLMTDSVRIQEELALNFSCPCNRQQIVLMLRGFGQDELNKLLAEQDPIEVTCEYCRQQYSFARDEIAAMSGAKPF